MLWFHSVYVRGVWCESISEKKPGPVHYVEQNLTTMLHEVHMKFTFSLTIYRNIVMTCYCAINYSIRFIKY